MVLVRIIVILIVILLLVIILALLFIIVSAASKSCRGTKRRCGVFLEPIITNTATTTNTKLKLPILNAT
jgi:ABC-type Na+ efflux pump permease subunit